MHNHSEISEEVIEVSTCPSCQTTIPVHTGYISWCDQCGWNLEPAEVVPPRNKFEALYIDLGKKSSQSLYQNMVDRSTLRPQMTFSKMAAYLIAAVIHMLTVIVLSGGLWMLFTFKFSPLGVFGLMLVGMAWMLRPRLTKMPTGILSRDQYPTLYKLTDRISEAMNTTPVEGLIIDSSFNAFFNMFGFRRKKIVVLGLPLLSILNREEKTAVIAHEIAHGANGDANRGYFISMALHSLAEWYWFIYPQQIWEEGSGIRGLLMIPYQLFARGVAFVIYWTYVLLIHLLFHQKQQAEYLADYMAAEVSGSGAMLSALSKLHYGSVFQLAMQKTFLQKEGSSFFKEFERLVDEMPQRELERIRRVELLEGSRLDVTHPPTSLRIGFLRERSVSQTYALLQPSEWEQLERELTSLQERVHKQLHDEWRDRLYY